MLFNASGLANYIGTVATTRMSLIQKLRDGGDDASWREFILLYQPLLMSYVQARGLPAEDAQDVVQEILVSLLRALPRFELDHGRGRFRTWLWRVTRNAIVDWARRQRRQKKAEKEWLDRLEALPAQETPEPEPEWDAAYRRHVLALSLGQLQKETQPRTWACFEKHVLEGRTGADIARELGLSVDAVYVNTSRVFARLRSLCARYREELEHDEAQ